MNQAFSRQLPRAPSSTDLPSWLVRGEAAALFWRLGLIGATALALAVATDGFLSPINLLNVLRQTSLLFLISVGLTFVVVAGGFDLSIASTLTLAACLSAGVLKGTGSIPLGILTGIGVGTVAGMLNGLAVTRLKLPPFLATYGMMWLLQGIAFRYMGGDAIYGFPPAFRQLGTGFFAGVPIPIYLLALFLALGVLIAKHTTFGKELYLIGSNRTAAWLSGIPVGRRLVAVYTLSGAMAGLAALVYLARVNSADAGVGEPLLLPAIAAVLIGGTSLFGGSGGLVGTMLGALILTLVINGMNLLNVGATWQPFITGAILLFAVLADKLSRRSASS